MKRVKNMEHVSYELENAPNDDGYNLVVRCETCGENHRLPCSGREDGMTQKVIGFCMMHTHR